MYEICTYRLCMNRMNCKMDAGQESGQSARLCNVDTRLDEEHGDGSVQNHVGHVEARWLKSVQEPVQSAMREIHYRLLLSGRKARRSTWSKHMKTQVIEAPLKWKKQTTVSEATDERKQGSPLKSQQKPRYRREARQSLWIIFRNQTWDKH